VVGLHQTLANNLDLFSEFVGLHIEKYILRITLITNSKITAQSASLFLSQTL